MQGNGSFDFSALAITAFYLMGAGATASVGAVMRRFGGHRVVVGGVLAMALGVAALGSIDRLWQLYAALARRSDVEIVSSPDPEHRSAVLVFTRGSKEKDAALVQHLDDQGIIVALRPLGVRVSPHFYNTEDDVARLLAALG